MRTGFRCANHRFRPLSAGAWVILVAAVSLGCRSGPRPWPLPKVADPLPAALLAPTTTACSLEVAGDSERGRQVWLELAERQYAEAVELRRAGSPAAVERFYQATLSSWYAWQQPIDQPGPPNARAWQLYHSSLNLLLRTAQDHGCWDPEQGLLIETTAGARAVPAVHRGFSWSPADFHRLELVGDYPTDELQQAYRRPGLGVPLVVIRQSPVEPRFYNPNVPFAATAVLRPASDAGGEPHVPPPAGVDPLVVSQDQQGVLEFVDPRRVGHLVCQGRRWPLASDLSAPFAWAISQQPRRAWQEFLRPEADDVGAKLFMLEPHQPGKIPIVFIHGLLSEPRTWVPMANDLLSDPWIRQHYELWGFRYPTGNPFPHSAAALRRELRELTQQIADASDDPAISRMILIGHSMGGLVAKLQVTSSGDRLWRSVANVPPESIRARPEQRQAIAEQFFVEPLPFVERVVFIATPHGGSSWANRLVGRLGSLSVRPASDLQQNQRELAANNPGAFAHFVRKGVPTSIDMLEPDNPLLMAMRCLPVSPRVRAHSVIGTGHAPLSGEPSDGVVPVSSARHDGVESEVLVDAKHEEVHKDPRTIAFLRELLREHAEGPTPGES